MSYFRTRTRLGDDATAAPPVDVPGDQETGSTSSSSTVQDTSIGPGGGIIGGQDTGVPTAPTSAWKNVNGICYGQTTDFLGTIKSLQRQLNRVADAKGIALIGVDGSVGPATLALMSQVGGMGAYAQVATGTPSSCSTVCSGIYAYIAATQSFADGLGASSSVSSPAPATTPSWFDPAKQAVVPQPVTASVGDLFANLSSTTQMAVMGGAGLLAWWAYNDSKKSRRKSRTRRY